VSADPGGRRYYEAAAMTTHPASRAPENEAVDRLRRRAWQAYLEVTRGSEEYEAIEQEAWRHLQERLADIEAELLLAHSSGA
jgi:hypothetical protein